MAQLRLVETRELAPGLVESYNLAPGAIESSIDFNHPAIQQLTSQIRVQVLEDIKTGVELFQQDYQNDLLENAAASVVGDVITNALEVAGMNKGEDESPQS